MAPLLRVPTLKLAPAPADAPLDELRPIRPPPHAVRVALRIVAVGVLAALWGKLFAGGFARGEAWLAGIPGLAGVAFWVELSGAGMLALTTMRTAFWLFYRPVPAGQFCPTVTAIVPAFNEGRMVRNALLSLARADYPAGKLHIIGVDDGSRDDTWEHMQAAARLHPDRIQLVRLPQNRGKRAALSAGFAAAAGEVVVTVDSDCIVAPDALRHLVAPLADPRVGAVAGKVVVHNRTGSLLSRMLAPQFLVTFDFLRAAQSVSGTVLCCPGALAAYRLPALRPLLPQWLDQRFWGTHVGPGEDRYLTTLLMRAGYQARYQSTATVHTLVPLHYRGISKMLLRWDRSDVRESLMALRHPPSRRGWERLAVPVVLAHVIGTLIGVPMSFVSVYALLAVMAAHPLVGLAGLGTLGLPSLMGLAQALCSDWSVDALWLLAYAYFSPAIIWIQPWAALTLRDQAWMSRRLPATVPTAARVAA
ncbi:MAG TPA: glycosyltransferase family 2 protein [Myxococcales bacterium]|nr:glycosyltransferase family 2 protein [Myxococcales bacterium]